MTGCGKHIDGTWLLCGDDIAGGGQFCSRECWRVATAAAARDLLLLLPDPNPNREECGIMCMPPKHNHCCRYYSDAVRKLQELVWEFP